MKISIYLLASLIIVLYSCRPKPIDIKIDEEPQKLVISSQVIPNDIMIVTVSKSFGSLAYSEENGDIASTDIINELLVQDALVIISYNDVTDTLHSIEDLPGIYISIETPQYLNANYNLFVHDSQTGETVTSLTNMLEQVTFNSVSAIASSSQSFDVVTVNYDFTDPENEENWYMVNFYTQSNSSVENGSPFSTNSSIPTETVLLSDRTFENSTYIGNHDLFDWNQDTVLVSISNINEDYYDYLTIRQRSGNLFTDLVKEPINYPTNVLGGYGFFTAHFPDLKIVEVEQ